MNSRKYILVLSLIIHVTNAAASANHVELNNNTAVKEENPVLEYLLQKWLIPKVEGTLKTSQNDSVKLIGEINNIFGNAILNANDKNIKIDYENALSVIKLYGRNILGKIIGKNDILLNILAQRKLNNVLDNHFAQFEGPIKRANFPISVQTRKIEFSSPRSLGTALVEGVFSNLIGQLLTPVKALIDQALINVSSTLMTLYQPIVPTDFFSSIFVTYFNEAIMGVVSFIDNMRTQINNILTPSTQTTTKALFKSRTSAEIGTKAKRSIIDVILNPLGFLAGILLTPLHNILKGAANYIFVTLRPVIGGIILGPLESLLLAIINLIPCSNC